VREDTIEYHFPGYNYLGPRTHVFDRIMHGVKPVDAADTSAMIHDVNYILANGDPTKLDLADSKALSRLSLLDPMRYVMQIGLNVRRTLGLYEGKQQNQNVGRILSQHLINSDDFKRYDIKSSDFV